jgi:all-trans-retinol 13,14-reductase
VFCGAHAHGASQLPSNFWAHPNPNPNPNPSCAATLQAEFPAVFISCPSAKDPDWATRYPGQSVLLVLVPAFYQPFEQWAGGKPRNRGADYDELKKNLTERMLAKLVEHLPQVRADN